MNNFFNKSTALSEAFGRFWDFLTKPHPSITEVGERRRAQLLSALSLILLVSFTWAVLSNPRAQIVFFVLLGITLVAYITSRTRFFGIGAYFFSFAFTSLAFISIANGSANSIDTSIGSIVPISLILASAILTQRGFLVLAIASVVAVASINSYADPKYLADPIYSRGRTIGIVFSLNLILYGITAFRASVERARLQEVQDINRKLETLSTGLEQRVAERTKALETSAIVSRRLASILDPNELASTVVNQVQTAFNYYYAQIYLFDATNENLVLTAGTGDAGTEMMKRGHRLPKGRGLVGRAAESNKSVLVPDTSQDPDWLPNPLLPDTKAEAAIPIVVGNRVLGVLDVQDNVTNDITSDDLTLLESLASQVAISLQNARQYLDSTRFRLGIENSGDAVFTTDAHGTITYANAAFEKVYGYSRTEVIGQNPRIIKSGLLNQENYQQFWGTLLSKQAVTGEIVNKHKDGHLVNIAGTNSAIVNDAGEIIGFLAVHHDITDQKKNQNTVEQRARQQEAINTITQRIQSAATIEEAMQVAARELGNALGKRQTLVALEPSALGGNGKTTVNA